MSEQVYQMKPVLQGGGRAPAEAVLPEYDGLPKSVRAAQIIAISTVESKADSTSMKKNYNHRLALAGGFYVDVSPMWVTNRVPRQGGWYVQYEDGTSGYVEEAVFITEYTPHQTFEVLESEYPVATGFSPVGDAGKKRAQAIADASSAELATPGPGSGPSDDERVLALKAEGDAAIARAKAESDAANAAVDKDLAALAGASESEHSDEAKLAAARENEQAEIDAQAEAKAAVDKAAADIAAQNVTETEGLAEAKVDDAKAEAITEQSDNAGF